MSEQEAQTVAGAAAAAGAAETAKPAAEQAAAEVKAPVDSSIEKLIADALDKRMGAVNQAVEKVSADQKEAQIERVREKFIKEKMADFPDEFKQLLPKTADVKELEKGFDKLRDQLNAGMKKYMKALGIKVPNILASEADGGTTPAKSNPGDKRSSSELVSAALRSRPGPNA